MLDKETIDQFADNLRGPLLQPGDPGYDEARSVWNGMIDRHPALIAQCTGTADVISTVNFAREQGLPLTVKGGGHNVAGKAIADGALVVDLSRLREVRVDPTAKTASVGPGATWADFDHEAQAFGLATTGGADSRTGVAGLTLGGGQGWLARRYGLAMDNLIGADIITADGKLVHASEDENPDLFWALRGGGSNFGVVTRFQFQLHEVGPELFVAQSYHLFEDGADVLRFYREFTSSAPDELVCYAMILRVPPAEPFPEAAHGKIMIGLLATYVGPMEEGRAALAPLKTFGEPILNFTMPMQYTALQSSFDAGAPDGQRYYYKTQYFGGLSDEAIDTLVNRVEPLPGAFTIVAFEPMGAAISRVDATATPFPYRDAAYTFSVWAGWTDPEDDEAVIAWARAVHNAIAPHASEGMYLNYLTEDDTDRVRAIYGPNYDRLQRVKARYDPDNLFSVNQNVEPATRERSPAAAA